MASGILVSRLSETGKLRLPVPTVICAMGEPSTTSSVTVNNGRS